jgi:hypothetical protein
MVVGPSINLSSSPSAAAAWLGLAAEREFSLARGPFLASSQIGNYQKYSYTDLEARSGRDIAQSMLTTCDKWKRLKLTAAKPIPVGVGKCR